MKQLLVLAVLALIVFGQGQSGMDLLPSDYKSRGQKVTPQLLGALTSLTKGSRGPPPSIPSQPGSGSEQVYGGPKNTVASSSAASTAKAAPAAGSAIGIGMWPWPGHYELWLICDEWYPWNRVCCWFFWVWVWP